MTAQIGIYLDRRSAQSFDVPDGVQQARHADGSAWNTYPLPTRVLEEGRPENGLRPALEARPRQHAGSGHESFTYEFVGLIAKLFEQRLSLGFYALIPNGDFTALRAPYVDEREQFFSNSLTHPTDHSLAGCCTKGRPSPS
jgi:hypothetical protein